MSLQWIVCGCLAAVEALLLLLLTIPSWHAVRAKTVPLLSKLMQPLFAVVPFAVFQLLDVYWKYEHKRSCHGEGGICTSADRDRHEKSLFKNQRNFILAIAAIFFYWLLYRFLKVHTTILRLEAEVKKLKDA